MSDLQFQMPPSPAATMVRSGPSPAQRCLSILLHEILDYIDLWDMLRAMCVNRHWREYAINHPTYYRDLRLTLTSENQLQYSELFLLRLLRSAGRPISINIDLHEQPPLPLMEAIGNHLAHITSLTINISLKISVAAILKALCLPAPALRKLTLRRGSLREGYSNPPQPSTLPADFLAQHAPALEYVELMGFDLASGIPDYFATIGVLVFYGFGWTLSDSVLPSPFAQCPRLRKLHLGNRVILRCEGCRIAWNRMTEVSFTGFGISGEWPALNLPLGEVQLVTLTDGNAESALALADTLLGALRVTFPPLRRHLEPFGQAPTYKAIFQNASLARDRSRMLIGSLLEHGCVAAFSAPSLADRIVHLDLSSDAWVDLVGLSTFGPFKALEELVLNLDVTDGAEFERATAAPGPKLTCPRLQRLVLRGAHPSLTVDMVAIANFAHGSLSAAPLPLMLEVTGIALAGAWKDFPETFSGCFLRGT